MQKFKPERLFHSKNKISKFLVDETQIKVGSEHIWLWVAIESETKNILAISISKEAKYVCYIRTFSIGCCVDEHGQHPVSTVDGGTRYSQDCRF